MHTEYFEIAVVFVFATLYALPSIVALHERPLRVVHVEAIIVNALLGWTVVGWFFALFLALDHARDGTSSTGIQPRLR